MRLQLLERRTPELETCAFCPKLSRAACPVSSADGRETTTPWGKMTAAYLLAREAIEQTPEQAWPPWACTGCFACRSSCELGNDVAGTLLDARADLVRAGLAPAAAMRVIGEHAQRTRESDAGLESAIDRARARGASVVSDERPGARAKHVLVVGCLASRGGNRSAQHSDGGGDEGDPAADAIVATSLLLGDDGPFGAPVAVLRGCCGSPLRAAGDLDGFRSEATALADRLSKVAASGAALVVADAGCAHTLARRYEEAGVKLVDSAGAPVRVEHITEVAARHLARIPSLALDARKGEAIGERVRYHDACALGRGLEVYDAPRALLTRLFSHPPDEFPRSRDAATCSGGGGIFPATDPVHAAAIAEARIEQHEAVGGGRIATTCAASRRMLARGGASVVDVVTLLARALELSGR